MPFGQIIIGPPGSGKSTYCYGISQFLEAIGRKCCVVNLDPQNDCMRYECGVNIMDLITVRDAMEEFGLGPNGGLMYCFEFIEKNKKWLEEQLLNYAGDNFATTYFLFDCPGQVELFIHDNKLKSIIKHMEKTLDFRFCAVNLTDSFHCSDASRYLSIVLQSLLMMVHLELPHVNVLSKIDIMESYGELPFNLDFYTEVGGDLRYLLGNALESDKFSQKFASLNEAIIELIEDFSLVSYYTLFIDDKESVANLLKVIDKANGYVFGALEDCNESIFQVAARSGTGYSEDLSYVKEKYNL